MNFRYSLLALGCAAAVLALPQAEGARESTDFSAGWGSIFIPAGPSAIQAHRGES